MEPVPLDVREATAADAPTLRHLLQLYLYDLGAALGWDVDDDGVFPYAVPLEGYWTDDRRHAFLVRVDGKLAGFALVQRGSELGDAGTHEMAEFFVLRKYRRQGIGERVARGLFDRLPGPWVVRELAGNEDGQGFWRAVVGRYTGHRFEDIEVNDERWSGRVQCFVALPGRSADSRPGSAGSVPQPPRWLIVVRRDREQLYRNLRESFGPEARVEVILDRRETDRGTARERRKRSAGGEPGLWEQLGLRLIFRDQDLRVYEAEGDRP